MAIITIMGFSEGNPQLVLYPYDTDGNQCGFSTPTKLFPYLYFDKAVSNFKTISTNIASGVCVSSCPSTYTGFLPCAPTTNNPTCVVLKSDFYASMACKLCIDFNHFSPRKILRSRSRLCSFPIRYLKQDSDRRNYICCRKPHKSTSCNELD